MSNFTNALQAVYDARQAHEVAIAASDAHQAANGGKMSPVKEDAVGDAAEAVGKAERALMAIEPQTPMDALRKVKALICDGMLDEAIDALRADAERLTEDEPDPLVDLDARCRPLRKLINSVDSRDPLLDDMMEELHRVEDEMLKHVPTTADGLAALANLLWETEGPVSHIGSPEWQASMKNPTYLAMLNLRTGARRLAGEEAQ
ncbi:MULTISPECIES: hypothetical protein [unclassified Sulfitobacter]|uniref:hypothetical protein n=1 Tax=unclassified Sulfitobacter TaxID=196795 RepID=UPI0023E2DA6D|nr:MULTISPECIES: hypothetical protein [unclassified Sulfitobacter]MDF3381953.1 hypothetical protein [Sulfitobacter sp. Ks11]MDF3385372.1 hypothetical protein [Sulfitobacter sp. M85]MDF3388791.1 hypothetical protein [Sulfitobacter sp. Ks16]MDF3399428.1 hypothetical protein [Sulfitobacter sp. KE39]MDF3402849.1 hypothetical protein [Sulfitobacter sp. Ks35]